MKNSKKLKLVCSAMLQSWRIRSLGPSQRYTELAPTKSGIIGMIACALGYERNDKRIDVLTNSTELYLDVKNSGSILESATINSIDTLIDYQTVMDKEKGMPTANGGRLYAATLIDKEYLVGRRFVLYLISDEETLNKIQAALKAPVWQYYLGSKCCIPAEPVSQGISEIKEGEINDYQIFSNYHIQYIMVCTVTVKH